MEKPKVKDIPKSVEFETVTPKSSEVREKLMTVEKEIKAVKDIVVPAPDPVIIYARKYDVIFYLSIKPKMSNFNFRPLN